MTAQNEGEEPVLFPLSANAYAHWRNTSEWQLEFGVSLALIDNQKPRAAPGAAILHVTLATEPGPAEKEEETEDEESSGGTKERPDPSVNPDEHDIGRRRGKPLLMQRST